MISEKRRMATKAWKEKNREKYLASQRKYNHEHCKNQDYRDYRKAWYRKNHERVAGRARAKYQDNREEKLEQLRNKKAEKYGVFYPTWWLCDGCSKPISLFKSEINLDHNYKTEKFRAWLCSNCNTWLGRYESFLASGKIERLLRLIA